MTVTRILLVTLLVSPCIVYAAKENPIRKVVNLLQAMQKKVQEEGEKEEEAYKKFQCYCKTGGSDLEKSIADANTKAPELESAINEGTSKREQLLADLKTHKSERTNAKAAIAKATSIREAENSKFVSLKTEADVNIKNLDGAISAISKGMAGFLQTDSAQSIRKIVSTRKELSDMDRDDVMSFLSGASDAPASGAILGILKQMRDEMAADLAGLTKDEESNLSNFQALKASKTKEIAAVSSSIESKTERAGNLAVEIQQNKGSLTDTQAALLEDKKFLKDLEENCGKKADEWKQRQATRAEELLALADTIKILNDDDALELFKKTVGGKSASLLQLSEGNTQRRGRALSVIQAVGSRSPGFDFIALALKGKSTGFEKVVKMIDELIADLHGDQASDDDKKEYCAAQFDQTDDKKKALERKVSDIEAAIAESKDGIDKTKDEIKALQDGIKALDKSVAQASELRKEEHKAFSELMSSNTAAVQLLHFAENRLNKFYNPKLYVEAPKRQLTREEEITVNMGGTLAPTQAPGGIANTGISGLVQIHEHRADPGAPPKTFGAYKSKGEENNGVMAMIKLLTTDLEKEMTEAETDERHSQEEYEQFMGDSEEKRRLDSKTLEDKVQMQASLEGDLQQYNDDHASNVNQLMATEKYLSDLHGECDWLVKYHQARKEARTGEIESLQNAKAVLSGSDFSFVQTAALRGSKRN